MNSDVNWSTETITLDPNKERSIFTTLRRLLSHFDKTDPLPENSVNNQYDNEVVISWIKEEDHISIATRG